MAMSTVLSPLAFLLSVLAGWLNDRQSRILEFLPEASRNFRRQLGKKRLRLTDRERRRLAAKGVHLGRKLLAEFDSTMTPDRILLWHSERIAKKWTYKRKRQGRPPTMKVIEDLVVRMAKEGNYVDLENRLIDPEPPASPPSARVSRRGRLGGLLNFYFRRAA